MKRLQLWSGGLPIVESSLQSWCDPGGCNGPRKIAVDNHQCSVTAAMFQAGELHTVLSCTMVNPANYLFQQHSTLTLRGQKGERIRTAWALPAISRGLNAEEPSSSSACHTEASSRAEFTTVSNDSHPIATCVP